MILYGILLHARQRLSCVVVHPCNAPRHLYRSSGVRALKGARTLVAACAKHPRLRCAMPYISFRWRVMLAIAPHALVDAWSPGGARVNNPIECALSPSLPLSLSPSSIDLSPLPCLPVFG